MFCSENMPIGLSPAARTAVLSVSACGALRRLRCASRNDDFNCRYIIFGRSQTCLPTRCENILPPFGTKRWRQKVAPKVSARHLHRERTAVCDIFSLYFWLDPKVPKIKHGEKSRVSSPSLAERAQKTTLFCTPDPGARAGAATSSAFFAMRLCRPTACERHGFRCEARIRLFAGLCDLVSWISRQAGGLPAPAM